MRKVSVSIMFLSLLILSLGGCAETRPETATFFESKTGLPLCKTAEVRNFKVGQYDYETDFTYGVVLSMSDTCQQKFLDQIQDRLGVTCLPSEPCRFMDRNSWFYELKPLLDGQIQFVLRAT